MFRIGLTVAALGLTACATTPSPYGGGMSTQNVNCGAGVLGGALLGGLAGNQVGKGQGQDLATVAGATVGGLYAATRPECQPQAYGQPARLRPAGRLRRQPAAHPRRLRPLRQAHLRVARGEFRASPCRRARIAPPGPPAPPSASRAHALQPTNRSEAVPRSPGSCAMRSDIAFPSPPRPPRANPRIRRKSAAPPRAGRHTALQHGYLRAETKTAPDRARRVPSSPSPPSPWPLFLVTAAHADGPRPVALRPRARLPRRGHRPRGARHRRRGRGRRGARRPQPRRRASNSPAPSAASSPRAASSPTAATAAPTPWPTPGSRTRAYRVAGLVLSGAPDPTNGALFFHSARAKPGWFAQRKRVGTIGGNVFYR